MSLQEKIINIDLDVVKILEDIPRDGEHAFLYARLYVGDSMEENLVGCSHACGTPDVLIAMLASVMIDNQELVPAFKKAIKLAEGVPVEEVLGTDWKTV